MKIIIIFIFIINLIFNQTMEVEIYKTQLDSLLNHPQIKTINRQYTSILGRNNDPKLITDISKYQLFIRKFGWTMLTIPELGLLIDILYPKFDKWDLKLAGTETWIVDCLSESTHPSHSHLSQSLEWVDRLSPKLAVLNHLSHFLDYDQLKRKLPDHIQPAYDGMIINV